MFDETFDACEDVEFNHRIDRAGLRCYFTPEVAVHYAPRDSLRGLFRQLVRYGRGRVRLWRKHPDSFSAGLLPPACLVAGTDRRPADKRALSAFCSCAYAGALLAYAAMVLCGCTDDRFAQKRLRLLPWLPCCF